MKEHKSYFFITKAVKIKYTIISVSCFLLIIIFIPGQFFFIKADSSSELSNTEVLKSLPYTSSWSPIKKENKTKMGVVKYDTNLSYRGINLYNSGADDSAYLIDMYGKIIHAWSVDVDAWNVATMNENCELFFISRDKMLAKIDWNSNIKWENKLRFHHYIYLAKNGDIYTLTRRRIEILYMWRVIPILNDYITILSSDGKVKKRNLYFKII